MHNYYYADPVTVVLVLFVLVFAFIHPRNQAEELAMYLIIAVLGVMLVVAYASVPRVAP